MPFRGRGRSVETRDLELTVGGSTNNELGDIDIVHGITDFLESARRATPPYYRCFNFASYGFTKFDEVTSSATLAKMYP